MYFLHSPRLAAHEQTFFCEVHCYFFATHLAALIAVQVEVISYAHNPRFGFIDGEFLFVTTSAACNIGDDGLIAEGRTRTIEEALPCVFFHAAGNVFADLFGLMLVKHRDDAAHHFAR
ncbi:MAG: hypothetical protein ABIS30_00710 [Gallionella sp.]